MQRYIELDSFTAVGAGETANLVLANGPRYDEIYLETNQASKIEKVVLKLNAVEVFSLSHAELEMMRGYDGLPGEAEFITLPMALMNAVLLDSREYTGLATGPGDNVVLEVTFKSDAVNPRLKAFANVSAHAGGRVWVRRFVRNTIPVAAEGEVDFTSMLKGPNIKVMRMFFKNPNIDKLEIKQDLRTVFELTDKRNDFLLKTEGKTVPSGYFVFDTTKRGFPLRDAMETAFQNLNFRLTVGAGGSQNIPVLIEQLEAVEVRDWRNR